VLFDESESTRTIQFTGSGAELNAFLAELKPLARILELARSGTAALDRGEALLATATA